MSGILAVFARPRLLVGGLALLAIAWIAATAPFDGPDESSHYDRAMILTSGELLGPQVPYIPSPGLTIRQTNFIDHDTRAVWVPADLMPAYAHCMDSQPNRSGCLVATPDGNFPPLGYVLPAAVIGFAHSASTALWLTRFASALQSLAFLALAVLLLWEGSAWSLLGLVGAVSPMVLFSASIMSSSGIEIASCLAFAAAGLRVARQPARERGRLWAAFGLAGAVAALTGPIDPVFVLADLLVFAGLLGRRRIRSLARLRDARLGIGAVIVALVIAVAYTHLAGFSSEVGFSPFWHSLWEGLVGLPLILRSAVGYFGPLSVLLPLGAVSLWWLLVIASVLAAVWLGTTRERIVVITVVLLSLAFPVLFYAWSDRLSGFGLQAREILPELMLIPLVSGEVVARHRRRLGATRAAGFVLAAALAVVAGVQTYAWWRSASAAAGAAGRFAFWAHPAFSPPAGWVPWISGACLGGLSLLAYAATAGVGGSIAPLRSAPCHLPP